MQTIIPCSSLFSLAFGLGVVALVVSSLVRGRTPFVFGYPARRSGASRPERRLYWSVVLAAAASGTLFMIGGFAAHFAV